MGEDGSGVEREPSACRVKGRASAMLKSSSTWPLLLGSAAMYWGRLGTPRRKVVLQGVVGDGVVDGVVVVVVVEGVALPPVQAKHPIS